MAGEGWTEWPFAEVIDFQEGPGILAKDFREDGIPLVRLAGLDSGASVLAGCDHLDPATVAKKWSHFALKEGDILLSTSASLGRVAVVGPEGIGAIAYTGIVRMRPRDNRVISAFIRYLLVGPEFQQQVDAAGVGSVIRHFGPMHLRGMSVHLPPADEQRAIAYILGTLDNKIELNRRMNETLEAIARAVFKSWFVDFDPVRAKASGEPPESICRRLGLTPQLLALFPGSLVDSEFGQTPEGWEQKKRVDDLLELCYGKALTASDRIDGLVPVYGSGGITGFHNQHLVKGPGIIVGRKGTVGSLYWEDRPFYPIDTVFFVQPKVQLIYCYYVLQTLGLERMNTDAAVPGLNRNNVYRLPVVWPPNNVREEFDRFTTPMRRRMYANNQELHTLEHIRDTLLPKLLSGELRVPTEDAI